MDWIWCEGVGGLGKVEGDWYVGLEGYVACLGHLMGDQKTMPREIQTMVA